MTNTKNTKVNTEKKPASKPQTFDGVVARASMKDTITVSIPRFVKHTKYHKYMKRFTKIMAHDAGNTKKVGDKVTIVACRPISKNKAFKVLA
jgi:small subunit ribosomal protein S17